MALAPCHPVFLLYRKSRPRLLTRSAAMAAGQKASRQGAAELRDLLMVQLDRGTVYSVPTATVLMSEGGGGYSGTRWSFTRGAQRDENRHSKNSTAVSLFRNHDLLPQRNTGGTTSFMPHSLTEHANPATGQKNATQEQIDFVSFTCKVSNLPASISVDAKIKIKIN